MKIKGEKRRMIGFRGKRRDMGLKLVVKKEYIISLILRD